MSEMKHGARRKSGGTRVKVSVSMSRSLRHKLEAARERSGYTISAEIEARLRDSLNHQGGDELLLLRLDDGLLAWLQAFVDGPGFFGDLNSTAVFFIRSQLQDAIKEDSWFFAAVNKLPSPIREANMDTPKYQRVLAAIEAAKAGRR